MSNGQLENVYAVQNMYSYNLKSYMSFSNLLCKKNFIFRFGDFISLENRGSRTFLALSDSTGYLTGAVTKPLVTGNTYRNTWTFMPFDNLFIIFSNFFPRHRNKNFRRFLTELNWSFTQISYLVTSFLYFLPVNLMLA